jgi:membrane protease YdiL (CAAX protease family)
MPEFFETVPTTAPPPPLPPTPPLPAPKPRVWTALLVPVLAVVVAGISASVLLVAFAMPSLGPEGIQDRQAFMDWVQSFGKTPVGILLLVLPGQLAFLAAALVAATLSSEPLRHRLGLVRPAVRWWTVLLMLPATLFSGILGDMLVTRVFRLNPGEHLKFIYDLFRGRTGVLLALITVLISVMPGFSEELLFRGYLQRRLLQRWHPAAAVSVSAVIFALAHMDPTHSLGVLPLGVWLGVVAWLSRSVWPGILCHAFNNAFAVIATNQTTGVEAFVFDASGTIIFGVTGFCAVLSIWLMSRAPSLSPGGRENRRRISLRVVLRDD